MKNLSFIREHPIFYGVLFANLIFISIYCFSSYTDLSLIRSIPVWEVKNPLSPNRARLDQILIFGSRGIYLYVYTFLFLGLFFLYGSAPTYLRRLFQVVVLLVSSLNAGVFLNTLKRPKIIKIIELHQPKPFELNPYKDELLARVRFTHFDETFQSYLKDLKAGRVTLHFKPYILRNGVLNRALKTRFKGHVIHKSEVEDFIEAPQLDFVLDKTMLEDKLYSTRLDLRSYQEKLQTRSDQFILKGREIPLSKDGAFMVVFYFETLDGKPLAVFH